MFREFMKLMTIKRVITVLRKKSILGITFPSSIQVISLLEQRTQYTMDVENQVQTVDCHLKLFFPLYCCDQWE